MSASFSKTPYSSCRLFESTSLLDVGDAVGGPAGHGREHPCPVCCLWSAVGEFEGRLNLGVGMALSPHAVSGVGSTPPLGGAPVPYISTVSSGSVLEAAGWQRVQATLTPPPPNVQPKRLGKPEGRGGTATPAPGSQQKQG